MPALSCRDGALRGDGTLRSRHQRLKGPHLRGPQIDRGAEAARLHDLRHGLIHQRVEPGPERAEGLREAHERCRRRGDSGVYEDPMGRHARGARRAPRSHRRLPSGLSGAKIEPISKADQHHGKIHFTWRMVQPDGTVAIDGRDFGELDETAASPIFDRHNAGGGPKNPTMSLDTSINNIGRTPRRPRGRNPERRFGLRRHCCTSRS